MGEEVTPNPEAPDAAADERTDAITWTYDIRLITNPFMLYEFVKVSGLSVLISYALVGLTGSIVEGGLALLPWPVVVVGFISMLVLMCAASLLMGNRSRATFVVSPKGVGYEAGSREKALSRTTAAVGALTGSATTGGAGALAVARDSLYLAWDDIHRVALHPSQRVISLKNAWRVLLRLYVPPGLWDDVSTTVEARNAAIAATRGATAPTSPGFRIAWVVSAMILTLGSQAWPWAESLLTVRIGVLGGLLVLASGLTEGPTSTSHGSCRRCRDADTRDRAVLLGVRCPRRSSRHRVRIRRRTTRRRPRLCGSLVADERVESRRGRLERGLAMNCPNCGGPVGQGDVFCGNCGASLAQQAAQQPTQEMPAAQQPQQPTQQMPAAQAPPTPGTQPTQQWQQPGVQPPPPTSGGGKTAIIVIVVILILLGLCTCAGFGAWYYYASQADDVLDTIEESTSTPTTTGTTEPAGTGYASPEEALLSELPADWVYELAADTPDLVEYWAGPPASEWMSVYIVERNADGTWYVADSYEYTMGLDDQGSTGSVTDADVAQSVVEDFLNAIMDDTPDAAQSLTVSPFRDDPASAQYARR